MSQKRWNGDNKKAGKVSATKKKQVATNLVTWRQVRAMVGYKKST